MARTSTPARLILGNLAIFVALLIAFFVNSAPVLTQSSYTQETNTQLLSTDEHYRVVAAGYEHSCAVRNDGTARCWGRSDHGQTDVPPEVFESITAGNRHTCGRKTDGGVVCWGDNKFGQATAPEELFISIGAGHDFTCGLTSSHAVVCWGDGELGRLQTPAGTFSSLTVGSYHACAANATAPIVCWGAVYPSAANLPSEPMRSMASGGFFTCGAPAAETVFCWGTGHAHLSGSQIPESKTGPFRSLTSGGTHVCGIHLAGFVECWGGSSLFGQTNVPDQEFRALAAGENHTCGITDGGSLQCWGSNTYGQSSPPPVGPLPRTKASGTFDNLNENRKGVYVVERHGPAVIATFDSSGTPVKHLSLQEPATLFVLPDDFRPAMDIEWEVEGWHVLAEGATGTQQAEPKRLHLKVSTDGKVSYADDELGEDVKFLRYAVRMAWPHHAAEPNVCGRSPEVKQAILSALAPDENSEPDCTNVSWQQLSTIETLGGVAEEGAVFISAHNTHDMAGLQNLREAYLSSDTALPAKLFSTAPRLRTLHVVGGPLYRSSLIGDSSETYSFLPADLLSYTPDLNTLMLGVHNLSYLPQEFADRMAAMEKLEISFNRGLRAAQLKVNLPNDFLGYTPNLTALSLSSGRLDVLTPRLLAHAPKLLDLRLEVGYSDPEFIPQLRAIWLLNVNAAGPFKEIASGGIFSLYDSYHFCGIRVNGALQCWDGHALLVPVRGKCSFNRQKISCGKAELGIYTPQLLKGAHVVDVQIRWRNACSLHSFWKLDCWDTITRKRQATPNTLFRAVSPGWDHICGLGIASELICWGDNSVGKSAPPTGAFQAVASGFDHVCALDFQGVVTCWGSNQEGQLQVPDGLYRSIASGKGFTCGIHIDGNIQCWGSQYDGHLEPPLGDFSMLSAGDHFVCAVDSNVNTTCWGAHWRGNPGFFIPPQLEFVKLSAEGAYPCGLTAAGVLHCWGHPGLG